jgi:hypothetical protein
MRNPLEATARAFASGEQRPATAVRADACSGCDAILKG